MENQRFRLWETRVLGSTDKQAGCVIENENRLVVACGNNTSIELVTIQPEGKKKMAASDYLRGHKVLKGTILG
jgi:methionyl-tRNA formyltransferase